MVLFKYDDFLTMNSETGDYYMAPDQAVRDEVEKNRWKGIGGSILTDWRLYLMLVPMLLVYLLWKYLPMTNLLDAFKYCSGTDANAVKYWMGFYYFQQIMYASSSYSAPFWNAFRNTFTTAFYGLLFGFPIPILLAIFFNEVRSNAARSILQVCVYLPKFLSTVVVTSLAITLFSGKQSSESAGVLTKVVVWFNGNDELLTDGVLQSAGYYRGVYIFTDLWEHAGYDSIVFFAAVIAISPTSYEAAQIDGAGKMAQMRYVVIPSILSTVVIMLIMKIGSLLSVGYEKIYLLESSKTYEVADVVSTWANRLTTNDSGTSMYAIAGEMLNNLIGMILVIGANTISKRASDVSLY